MPSVHSLFLSYYKAIWVAISAVGRTFHRLWRSVHNWFARPRLVRRIDAARADTGRLRNEIRERTGHWDDLERGLIANELQTLVDVIDEGALLDNAATKRLSQPKEVIRTWVMNPATQDTTLILALDGIEQALRSRLWLLSANSTPLRGDVRSSVVSQQTAQREQQLGVIEASSGEQPAGTPPANIYEPSEAALLSRWTQCFAYSTLPEN